MSIMEENALKSSQLVKNLFHRLRNYDDNLFGKKTKVMDSSCFGKLFKGDMSSESERIATFVRNGWSFEVSASEMSSAGFCLVANDGPVVCFHCKGTISNGSWQHGDSPLRIHRKKFPRCSFAETKDKHSRKSRRGPKHKGRVVFDTACTTPDVSKSMQSTSKQVTDIDGSYDDYLYDFLSSEYNRLVTFRFWPEDIPIRGPSLAASGLYRLDDSSDRLRCFACLKDFDGWRGSDGTLPLVRHIKESPTCPFANQQETGNRRITEQEKQQADALFQSLRLKVQHPTDQNPAIANATGTKSFVRHPSYHEEEDRMRSFESWPKENCQEPDALAKAGFFYLGKDDCVACFYCGGELLDWEPEDDPFEEHVTHCPECKWAEMERSKIRVMEMKKKLGIEDDDSEPNGNDAPLRKSGTEDVITGKVKASQENSIEEGEASKEVEYEPAEDGSGKKLLLVEPTQETKVDNPENSHEQQTKTSEKSSSYTKTDEAAEASLTKGFPRLQIGGGCGTPVTSYRAEANIGAEIERLRDQNLCKICLDGDIEVLFLPCRHLSVCQTCSGQVETCPMCREYIDDRLTVFV